MAKRPLWIIAVLLLGAAAALWGANGVSWYPSADVPKGHLPNTTFTVVGNDAAATPSFSALALLALASLAGLFAVAGLLRRVLGGLIVVAGGYVCWQAFATGGTFDLFTGRGLALLGGVLFLAAGVLIALYANALPTMGSKYELAATERRSGDPHKDMWDGLSDGDDPTADEPRT